MDDLYRSIQNLRYVYQIDGSRAKRKEPEYPDLIYAIFKARQKNMEYPEIYSLYKDGGLPYYSLVYLSMSFRHYIRFPVEPDTPYHLQ